MRRLILFRHAKAEPRGAGMDDFDRPLSPRGREDAALMGQVLAREGLAPDFALVSPARRTAETWIFAREAFPKIEAKLDRALYDATPEAIREAIAAVEDEVESLIVVGHNPGLHQLALALLIEGSASRTDLKRVADRFPTSAAAVLAIDENGRAAFDGLFLVKEHGGEGEG